jgi:hypothetical protein
LLHIPDAILLKIDATWDNEKIYLAICNRVRKEGKVGLGLVKVAWLKGNLCGEGDGTPKDLNSCSTAIMRKVCA